MLSILIIILSMAGCSPGFLGLTNSIAIGKQFIKTGYLFNVDADIGYIADMFLQYLLVTIDHVHM